MGRIVAFHVEFELPSGASVADCVDYIESALLTECGMRNPDRDPMARFNRQSIEIRSGRRTLANAGPD